MIMITVACTYSIFNPKKESHVSAQIISFRFFVAAYLSYSLC